MSAPAPLALAEDGFVADGADFFGLPLSGDDDVAPEVEAVLALEDGLDEGTFVVDDDDRPVPEGLVDGDGDFVVEAVAVGDGLGVADGDAAGVVAGVRVGGGDDGRTVVCFGAGA